MAKNATIRPHRIKMFEADTLSKTLKQMVDIFTVNPNNPQSSLVKRCDAPLTMLDGLKAADCWEARGYVVEIRVVSQPS